jgi:hypothetical protein
MSKLSRRTLVTSAAALPALAAPAGAAVNPSTDEKLRQLWAKYLAQAAIERAAFEEYKPARVAYDAEVPPCPKGVLPGHHFKAQQPLREKYGCDRLYDAWNEADVATREVVEAIRAIEAQSLFGVGVKLAALPVECDPEDSVNTTARALEDIDRLLGASFASQFKTAQRHFEEEEDDEEA